MSASFSKSIAENPPLLQASQEEAPLTIRMCEPGRPDLEGGLGLLAFSVGILHHNVGGEFSAAGRGGLDSPGFPASVALLASTLGKEVLCVLRSLSCPGQAVFRRGCPIAQWCFLCLKMFQAFPCRQSVPPFSHDDSILHAASLSIKKQSFGLSVPVDGASELTSCE